METKYTINEVTYIGLDLLVYSDYSNGGSVCRANVRDVLEMAKTKRELSYRVLGDFDAAGKYSDYRHDAETVEAFEAKPDVIELHGGYGTHAVIIREDWDEADDILAALANYPALNDSTVSEVELEMEQDAWDSWIASDFERDLCAALEIEEMPEGVDLVELYRAACEAAGEYGFVDGDDWWIDLDKIVPAAVIIMRDK